MTPVALQTRLLSDEQKLVEQLRQEGIEVGLHICGNTTGIIEDMVASMSIHFELDYKSDWQAIRAATNGKTTIIGAVDPSNLIPFGTPEEVKAKAREDIEIVGQNGRFILGAGCILPHITPFKNVHALVEAAHENDWHAGMAVT